MFCGVVAPPPLLPYFWRVWMFPLTPFKYVIETILGIVLTDQPIRCATGELSTIQPPPGQTCDSYLSNFSVNINRLTTPAQDKMNIPAALQGYYIAQADGTCSYCTYRLGTDYMASIEMNPQNRFRDIGILMAYCVFNILLFFFGFWLFRIASFKRNGGGKVKKAKKTKGASKGAEAEMSEKEKHAGGTDSASASDDLEAARTPSDADRSG